MRATIQQSTIHIPSLPLPDGRLSVPVGVDLTPYQGATVRLYLSAAGMPQINPAADSYWQVAEVALPPAATESVVVGSRDEFGFSTVMVARGEGDTDAVTPAANQWVDAVGFAWARYRLGDDYTVTPAGIVWTEGGRRPEAGAEYPAELATASPVPITESRALPLDLAAHSVTLFDLPQ